jgi:hypothetical protein
MHLYPIKQELKTVRVVKAILTSLICIPKINMAGVSAESNALFVAFRRLVYNFSEQVSKEEQKTIIYIRLYQQKERYKDATVLEVLSKLEADGAFGPSNPEGLLEIAKDIKRQDLASEVKHYIKKRSKGESKGGLSSLSAALTKKVSQPQPPVSPKHQYGGEPDSEEDLQLKSTVEVTLAQATVLLQQIEKLERAVAGGKAQRQRAKEAISEAGQTAAALADRLKKARMELGLGGSDADRNTSTARPAATVQGMCSCFGRRDINIVPRGQLYYIVGPLDQDIICSWGT